MLYTNQVWCRWRWCCRGQGRGLCRGIPVSVDLWAIELLISSVTSPVKRNGNFKWFIKKIYQTIIISKRDNNSRRTSFGTMYGTAFEQMCWILLMTYNIRQLISLYNWWVFLYLKNEDDEMWSFLLFIQYLPVIIMARATTWLTSYSINFFF